MPAFFKPSIFSDRLADWLNEGTAAVMDVKSRRDGEKVAGFVSRGENVAGVFLTASRIQEKTSAVQVSS